MRRFGSLPGRARPAGLSEQDRQIQHSPAAGARVRRFAASSRGVHCLSGGAHFRRPGCLALGQFIRDPVASPVTCISCDGQCAICVCR